MTDAPLSNEWTGTVEIGAVHRYPDDARVRLVAKDNDGAPWRRLVESLTPVLAESLVAQLAAAARVPELEAEIRFLKARFDHLAAAATDLTELRAAWDAFAAIGRGEPGDPIGRQIAFYEAVERLLAAVPSTGTDTEPDSDVCVRCNGRGVELTGTIGAPSCLACWGSGCKQTLTAEQVVAMSRSGPDVTGFTAEELRERAEARRDADGGAT